MKPAPEDAPNSSASAADRINISGLSGVLDRIAAPDLLARGCVNIVGIEPVQEKLGRRWPRMREHIHDRVEKYITRQLSASEYYCRLSDVQYVISLPDESAHSAQLRCFRVLEEILTTLLGRFTIDQIKIRAVTEADGNCLITKIVDAAALAQLAACAPKAEASGTGTVVPFLPPGRRAIRVGEKELHLQFKFHPVWDLRREVISSFALHTAIGNDQDRASGGKTVDRSQLTNEELTAIDIAASEHGRDVLNHLLQRQCRFILHLPCAYETLANMRTRPRFLETLMQLSADQRRYVVYELTDLPVGVPQSRISDLAAMLRPFGRGIMARARPSRSELLAFHGCGLHGLALDLQGLEMREDQMFERIGLFRDIGQIVGDQLLAYGVTSKSLAIACWALGLSHMSGPAVAPAVAIPRQMHRFSARDLYRN